MLHGGVIIFRGQIQKHLQLIQLFPFAFPALDYFLELTMFFMHLPGNIGIVPEIRGESLLLQPLQFIFFMI
jgi:hypothetical protein